jgi:hypothetical protein
MPCYDAPKGADRHALPAALRGDPILLPLYEYWARQRGARDFPDRADISPHGIGTKVLPHVGMAELDIGNLPASRMRLVGTAVVDELGFDPTGKQVHEYASGQHLELLVSLAQDMLRHRRPVFSETGFHLQEDRLLIARRLYLPLSHGGSEPAILLFGQTFQRAADDTAFRQATRSILPG